MAARTIIQQNQAAEITANLRPNPTFFTDWEYLPLFTRPQGETVPDYLQASTEGDLGLSYLIERGKKRQRRLQAARDATAVTRATVFDNERSVAFQVGQLFYNVELAESTLDLAQAGSESFQKTVDIGEIQFKDGGISQNDFLQLKLQLVQFQTNAEQAVLARDAGAFRPPAAIGLRIGACRVRRGGRIRIPAAGGHSRRIATESPSESPGSARRGAGHYRRRQPICARQGEWKTRSHSLG